MLLIQISHFILCMDILSHLDQNEGNAEAGHSDTTVTKSVPHIKAISSCLQLPVCFIFCKFRVFHFADNTVCLHQIFSQKPKHFTAQSRISAIRADCQIIDQIVITLSDQISVSHNIRSVHQSQAFINTSLYRILDHGQWL